jgi:hypothetical protein
MQGRRRCLQTEAFNLQTENCFIIYDKVYKVGLFAGLRARDWKTHAIYHLIPAQYDQ